MPDPEAQFLDALYLSVRDLKTAYARTGVRRQSELVRLVTAALRDLADHRGANGG